MSNKRFGTIVVLSILLCILGTLIVVELVGEDRPKLNESRVEVVYEHGSGPTLSAADWPEYVRDPANLGYWLTRYKTETPTWRIEIPTKGDVIYASPVKGRRYVVTVTNDDLIVEGDFYYQISIDRYGWKDGDGQPADYDQNYWNSAVRSGTMVISLSR